MATCRRPRKISAIASIERQAALRRAIIRVMWMQDNPQQAAVG